MLLLSIRRRYYIIAAAAVATGICLWYLNRPVTGPYSPSLLSFDDTSDRLHQTVVVPTLDSPIPDGKSAIWCVSFQLAWNRLKDDVVKGPIQLANAQAIADRLKRADQSEDVVPPDAVFAAAGLAKDGIVERIRNQMAGKFPGVPAPEFGTAPGGAIAYAYLAASSKYDYPFFENDEYFIFTDSAGTQIAIGSFGIRRKDRSAYERLRKQVEVLYCPSEAYRKDPETAEFVLDLCKTSMPFQVVLARVDRKATLADTLAAVEQKIATPPDADLNLSTLGPNDSLLVPNVAWKISHEFAELEGADERFLNPELRGMYLDKAIQTIQFRMDRSGVELSSVSTQIVRSVARLFHFDRPFLIYMKKRGGKQPFFVMWVDNAELLQKK